METAIAPGCGASATRIAFRGKTRRSFFCETCAAAYEGGGRVEQYVVGVDDPETRVKGVYRGPSRTCGEETNA